jgi:hypothetical protein
MTLTTVIWAMARLPLTGLEASARRRRASPTADQPRTVGNALVGWISADPGDKRDRRTGESPDATETVWLRGRARPECYVAAAGKNA